MAFFPVAADHCSFSLHCGQVQGGRNVGYAGCHRSGSASVAVNFHNAVATAFALDGQAFKCAYDVNFSFVGEVFYIHFWTNLDAGCGYG